MSIPPALSTPVLDETSAISVYDQTFWLAYLANTILVLANSLTYRFAELVHFLGGSERVTGDILATGLTVAVLTRLFGAHLIDDYGTRRLWTACSLLFITGCCMFLLCGKLSWELYAARIVFVVGMTGMFTCSMTHIQNHVPPHRRTEVIGNLGSSGFVGMIVGSNTGDWILRTVPAGRTQFLVLFGAAALLGCAYLIVVRSLTAGQNHSRTVPSDASFRLLIRHWPGMVVAAAMSLGLGVAATTVFLTRLATEQHLGGIGAFFTGFALSAFAFRLIAAQWSRTIGRYWMLVRGLFGYALGHLLIGFADEGWELVIPSIICGFGHALLFPAIVSLGAGAFPTSARGTGTACIMAFTDLGTLVASPLLGRIIVAYGFSEMYFTASAVTATLGVVYIVIALRYRDADAISAARETEVT